jgi:hypothetical protein
MRLVGQAPVFPQPDIGVLRLLSRRLDPTTESTPQWNSGTTTTTRIKDI